MDVMVVSGRTWHGRGKGDIGSGGGGGQGCYGKVTGGKEEDPWAGTTV